MGNLGSGRPLNRTVYRNSFGVSIDRDFGDRMQRLGGGGLLRDDGEHVDLTDLGRLVYDRVLLCFYPERAVRWLRDGTSSQLGQEAPTGTVRA
jgi:coproporphyrinogen III oxidase-like Fe-S oxidoreductase